MGQTRLPLSAFTYAVEVRKLVVELAIAGGMTVRKEIERPQSCLSQNDVRSEDRGMPSIYALLGVVCFTKD